MIIKRIVLVAALVGFAATALTQGKKANFAGTWNLDIKNSVNLQTVFKSVASYVLDVRQSGDSVTVLATLTVPEKKIPYPAAVYVMNGKQTHHRDSVRERWTTARWGKDGKSATIDTKVHLVRPGRPPTVLTQHDDWKLTDPSTLEVSVTQVSGAGKDSTRVEKRIFKKTK